MEHGVRVNIVGNLSLIPDRLRKLMAEAMNITKDNNKAMLNVAFAYTCESLLSPLPLSRLIIILNYHIIIISFII